jgi:hypothetical protein
MRSVRRVASAIPALVIFFGLGVSSSLGQGPPLPQLYTGIQAAGSGETFSFEVAADRSHVAQLTLGWNCPDRLLVAIALLPNVLPISIDADGRSRFSARDIQVGADTLGIDGIIFDGDASDGTAEQALGGVLLTRNGSVCTYKWWATANLDDDLDGWSNGSEVRYGSNPNVRSNTPEHREVPQGLALHLTGPCTDSSVSVNHLEIRAGRSVRGMWQNRRRSHEPTVTTRHGHHLRSVQ